MNVGAFGTCLGTGKYKEKVERETAAAANLGGRGTPFFIVNQRPLVGAQPYAVFEKMIEEELKSQEDEKENQVTERRRTGSKDLTINTLPDRNRARQPERVASMYQLNSDCHTLVGSHLRDPD